MSALSPNPTPPSVAGLPGNLVYALPSILHPLDFARMFPVDQPVEVELGCGDGSFLIARAAACPHLNFIGVERLLGRVRKLDRKGRRLGLLNLRGVRLEAAYFLEYLLPPESLQALHVYFPDPWPKTRHQHRRLVNTGFPQRARAALKPGGAVYLRTDDASYFAQMRTVFADAPGFEAAKTPAELAANLTDFEREFLAQGKSTLRAAYQRRDG